MATKVIDYSQHYFEQVVKKTLPRNRRGKFVIIKSAGDRYIVFSPRDFTTYHANIVEHFFEDKSVKGSYNDKQDKYDIFSSEWKIEGGGHWELNSDSKRLRIYGESLAYGAVDLKEIIDTVEKLKAFVDVSLVTESN